MVATRLDEIRNVSSTEQWHYIPTKLNPADLASRGLSPRRTDNANTCSLNGPAFLREPSEGWNFKPLMTDSALLPEILTEATVSTAI